MHRESTSPRPPGPRRRAVLLGAAGATGMAAGLGLALGPGQPRATASSAGPPALAARAGARGLVPGRPPAPSSAGTTVRTTAAAVGSGSYRRLAEGAGWPRVVRTELGPAAPRRADRRTPLAAFVQLTDLHIVDVQTPLRSEYFRERVGDGWRPQEALSVPGAVALIERVNSLTVGPATGIALGCAVTTGDNTDNNSSLELEWFLTAMSGGRIVPNSGDPTAYEGVQDSGVDRYWHPESRLRDADKALGFPRVDGYLRAAIREVTSPGLHLPWYSTVGNHDLLPGGCYAARQPFFAEYAVGDRKLMTLPESVAAPLFDALRSHTDPRGEAFAGMLRAKRHLMRKVTPDERRVPFTSHEYVAAHLQDRFTGAGPVGHGYTDDNRVSGELYYDFALSGAGPGVVGISLDTTDQGGDYRGSVGTAQLRWLARKLTEHRDAYVIVFSHHTSKSMDNTTPDPFRPDDERHTGPELLDVLLAHRNVVAWVNGHSHRNQITAHGGEGGGLWEITTASHVDFPQLARVVELADNGDGTLSLFTTLIESAAPYRADAGELDQTGLASLYRELALNAPHSPRRRALAGTETDRNTELLRAR
ncbi:TIGR03767 family metallophosphoesterase [Streptomyces sp. MAR4 CNX-425]|uniref:TIGR03767 family metallophosphoesterase n=1 Tax=Streptomyces sp. MAR4 CNX-425 TaxID=3406343 RepID=UPI003B506E6E